MGNQIAVVEYYEARYGFEEKRLFKVFSSRSAFDGYCVENGIQVIKTQFGTKYYIKAEYLGLLDKVPEGYKF